MTANHLILNSSKTEFLLIGLSKQLAKINNSSLTTTHSARNLGFIFDEHLTFSDQISLHFLVVGSVRYIKLTHVGFRAHVKIASRIVSYPTPCFKNMMTKNELILVIVGMRKC